MGGVLGAGRKPIFGFGINDADYCVAWRPDPKIRNKQEFCPFYKRWHGMLWRGLVKNYGPATASYMDTTVCDSFKYFMDFRKWAEELGFDDSNKHLVDLDKDILIMGNNCYSMDKCVFIPAKLNRLILTSEGKRGNTSLGTQYEPRSNRYVAGYSLNRKRTNIGTFDTELEAHPAWQIAKAKYIEDHVSGYEQECENIGLVYRQDVFDALIGRVQLLRDCAESGKIINSL